MQKTAKIKSFRDLQVWQEAHALVLAIYAASSKFPKDELFGLTSQMRRAAVSITSNIAEGFSRESYREKAQFYSMAHGSLTELENQVIIAKDVNYLDADTLEDITRQLYLVHRILNAFIRTTKSVLPNSRFQIPDSQKGQIIIIAAVFMLIIMVLVVAMVGYAGVQIKGHRQAVARVQGLNIAEAAIEKAIWKLNNEQNYTGETATAFSNGVYNVTVTAITGSTKLVRADSYIPNASTPRAHRTVQATVTIGSTNVAFNYGVQVGDGGLQMDNNSEVTGNVYSNGNIIGSAGAIITGTATVAGATGKIDAVTVNTNANGHFLEDITVGGSTTSSSLLRGTVEGNVVSDTISNCTIGGNATFDTQTSCTITGTQTTPNPNNFVDPTPELLPISDGQIDAWEEEAEDGGAISSYTLSNGASASLGPKKINGNLTLDNNAVLTVTGTLWVTGQIDLSNGAIIKLDTSYGNLSGIVLAGIDGDSSAGYIELDNGSNAMGSGVAGSYILLLSQRNNSSSIAIKASNNATGAILYAGEGVIEVDNNAGLKEITAYKIHLKNNASVTYESGLASALFSSGPGGGWEILDGTWQLLQ